MSSAKAFQDLPGDVLYLIMRQFDSFSSLHSFVLTSKVHSQVFEFNKGTIAGSIASNQFDKKIFEILELSRPDSLAKATRKMFIEDTENCGEIGEEDVALSRTKFTIGLPEAKRLAKLDREIKSLTRRYANAEGVELSEEEEKSIGVAVCNMWILTSCFKWEKDGGRTNGLYDYTTALQMTPRAISEVLKLMRNINRTSHVIYSLQFLIADFNKMMREGPIPVNQSLMDLSILALHSLTEDKSEKFQIQMANTMEPGDKPVTSSILQTQYVSRKVVEEWHGGRRSEVVILIRTPLRVRKHPAVKQIRRPEYVKRKYRKTLAVQGNGPPVASSSRTTTAGTQTPLSPDSTASSTPASTVVSTPVPSPGPTAANTPAPETPQSEETTTAPERGSTTAT